MLWARGRDVRRWPRLHADEHELATILELGVHVLLPTVGDKVRHSLDALCACFAFLLVA